MSLKSLNTLQFHPIPNLKPSQNPLSLNSFKKFHLTTPKIYRPSKCSFLKPFFAKSIDHDLPYTAQLRIWLFLAGCVSSAREKDEKNRQRGSEGGRGDRGQGGQHVVNICMPRGGRKCTRNDGDKNPVPGQPLFPGWTRPPLRTSAIKGRPFESPSVAEAAELHLARFFPPFSPFPPPFKILMARPIENYPPPPPLQTYFLMTTRLIIISRSWQWGLLLMTMTELARVFELEWI